MSYIVKIPPLADRFWGCFALNPNPNLVLVKAVLLQKNYEEWQILFLQHSIFVPFEWQTNLEKWYN